MSVRTVILEGKQDTNCPQTTRSLREFYPRNGSKSILDSEATSQLVHKPHFDRITKFIEQAKADGHYVIGGESDEERRKVGLTCVKIYADKESTGGLMTEEIFGPILPIISVQVRRPVPTPWESTLPDQGINVRSRSRTSMPPSSMSTPDLPRSLSTCSRKSARTLNTVRCRFFS